MPLKRNQLPPKLRKEIRLFFNTHPPAIFSSKLRTLVFDYMYYELKKGIIPIYLEEFLWSLNDFFDVLDTAAKELPNEKL